MLEMVCVQIHIRYKDEGNSENYVIIKKKLKLMKFVIFILLKKISRTRHRLSKSSEIILKRKKVIAL